MKKIIFSILFIPLFALGQIVNSERYITVSGTSEIEVNPDRVILKMSSREAENTKKESDIVKMETNITDLLKSLGLQKDVFTIDELSASNQTIFSTSHKFKLNKAYQIILNNTKLLDTIVAKCFEYGMDQMYVERTEYSHIDSLRNVLLINALNSAKLKAEVIAKAMNVVLGDVLFVNESNQIADNNSCNNNDYFNKYKNEDAVMNSMRAYQSRVSSGLSVNKLYFNKNIIVRFRIK